MLQWASSDVPTGGAHDWRAVADGSEYRIKGPLERSDPATRTVMEYYVVSRARSRSRKAVGAANEHIGEALTLQEAKAMAQRYHNTRGKVF